MTTKIKQQTLNKQGFQPGNEHGNRWLSGESGNPAGRPKNSLTSLLRDIVEANDEEKKRELADELVNLATARGARGQIPALMEILNRLDGKVTEKHLNVNVTTTPEGLLEAQERLLNAQARTNALKEKYKDAIK
ncbi:hypothetical protein LCGC14_0387490 [marine sediment metagenome]|uniref:DUF5681 domain-containing protein n=1 Tax=marine sediment metagenome TaxID=412755 RepID=A0A0F9TIH5_9ZZZZ